MAPKNKDSGKADKSKAASGGAKGKGKGKEEDGSAGGGKLKAAQSVNVRHILVCRFLSGRCFPTPGSRHLTYWLYLVRETLKEGRGAGQIARWCEVR